MNPLLQKIAEEFGFGELPEEKKVELITRIGGVVYQGVLMRTLNEMSEEEQAEFETMLDKDTPPDQLFVYLKEKVPSIDSIIKEETEKFKQDTISVMSQI